MLGLEGDAGPACQWVLAYYTNLVQIDRLLTSAAAAEEKVSYCLGAPRKVSVICCRGIGMEIIERKWSGTSSGRAFRTPKRFTEHG